MSLANTKRVRHACQIINNEGVRTLATLNFNFKAIYIDQNKNKIKANCGITQNKISVQNDMGQTVFEKTIADFYYISCKSGKERIGLFSKLYVEISIENEPVVKVFCKKETEITEVIAAITKHREEIIKERTSIYDKAVSAFKKNTIKSCEEALSLFSSVRSWLDSKEYIEKCQQKISELKEKAEIERKNGVYSNAIASIKKKKTEAYLSALVALKEIEDWKDAKEKIKECEEALDKIYEEAASLMKEETINKLQEAVKIFDSLKDFRNAKDLSRQCYRKIEEIKTAIENEKKGKIYAEAVEISKDDTIPSIDKAISLLKEIKGWNDVDTLVKTLHDRKDELERIAEEKRKQGIYDKAVAEGKKDTINALEQAISILKEISGWKDVNVLIKTFEERKKALEVAAEEKRKNDIYQNATNFIQANTIESLEKAIKLFETILEWKDSKEQITFCEKQIKKIREAAFWEIIEAEKERCKKQDEDPKKYSATISKTTKAAVELFTHNPYCVLGLSCRASQNDALNVKDKVEKFARLKMTNAYKSAFDLKNLEKPSRDISNIQSSIVAAKELSHKWLWFVNEEYACWWDSAKIFDVLEKEEVESIDYDLLLAAYIQLVITDGSFNNFDKWQYLLTVIDNLLSLPSMKLSSILKLHIDETSTQESIGTLTESFKKTFLSPFYKLCENAGKAQISNLGKCLKKTFKSKELTDGLASALILNLTNRCYALESFLKEFPEEKASTEEKDKLVELAKSTENEVYENIDVLLKIVGTDSTYAKRIKKKYKELYWDVTLKLLNNNRKATCVPFIKKIYGFCDEGDQRRLRNTYGYKELGLTVDDLTPDEMNDIALAMEKDGDISEAMALLIMAANNGSDFAQSNLAFRYFEGKGVPQNRGLAKMWWTRAAQQGNEVAQNALRTMFQIPHEHYDLGYVYVGYNETKFVEVTLTYIGYVRLMGDMDFRNYINGGTYNYYGGRQTQNPCRIKIPCSGNWHVVVDNDGDEMGGLSSTCYTKTIPNYY